MIRLAPLAVLLVFAIALRADPIKKDKPPELDKLAREQVEKFRKAVFDGKPDDAVALMGLPFMTPDGIEKNHDKFKQAMSEAKPPGLEIKTLDSVEPKRLNEYLKDKKMTEHEAEKIASYEKHVGKDGRIVVVQMTLNGQELPTKSPVVLIAFGSDKKPKVVGFDYAR
jgi:hypothetical protein